MRRCLFLDRDGVINAAPLKGEYIRSPEQFHLLPNIPDWIRLFNAVEFLVVVVTNQRGVALGLMTADDLAAIHDKMVRQLAALGARIDDIFSCPHGLDACECRKPKPGLVYAARDKWNIDLSQSLLLGDSENDRELAMNCNLRFLRVKDGRIVGAA